jgi:hypothetical protein
MEDGYMVPKSAFEWRRSRVVTRRVNNLWVADRVGSNPVRDKPLFR